MKDLNIKDIRDGVRELQALSSPEVEILRFKDDWCIVMKNGVPDSFVSLASLKPTSKLPSTEGQTNTIKDCLSDIKFKHHGD